MAVKIVKQKVRKSTVILIIFLALVVAGAISGGIILADSLGVNIADGTKRIEIKSGSSASDVVNELAQEDIIKYPLIFQLQARMGDYAQKFQPGVLEVTDGMSYKQILELLCVDNRNSVTITIPEGYEQKQIVARLVDAGLCTEEEFNAAAHDDYGYDFLQGLPDREKYLEGYLFPDTYFIPEDASAHDIIDMMLSRFNECFTPEMRQRAQDMGYSIDQIVTMASIIERETDSENERAKVAGVFYNRINDGMKLQSCATVQYILGERKPVLSVSDTTINSPYNTYLYSGLPIGPIANPGLDCLQAALYPEDTEYYYFVQGKDGQHIFSKTYEEHLAAMQSTEAAIEVDEDAIYNEDNLQNGAN